MTFFHVPLEIISLKATLVTSLLHPSTISNQMHVIIVRCFPCPKLNEGHYFWIENTLSASFVNNSSTFPPGSYSIILYLSTRIPQTFLLPFLTLLLPPAMQSSHSPHLNFPTHLHTWTSWGSSVNHSYTSPDPVFLCQFIHVASLVSCPALFFHLHVDHVVLPTCTCQ